MDYHEGRKENEHKRRKKKDQGHIRFWDLGIDGSDETIIQRNVKGIAKPSIIRKSMLGDLYAQAKVANGTLDPFHAIIDFGVNVGFEGDKE